MSEIKSNVIIDQDEDSLSRDEVIELFSFDQDFTQESEIERNEFLIDSNFDSNIDYFMEKTEGFTIAEQVDYFFKEMLNNITYYKDYELKVTDLADSLKEVKVIVEVT